MCICKPHHPASRTIPSQCSQSNCSKAWWCTPGWTLPGAAWMCTRHRFWVGRHVLWVHGMCCWGPCRCCCLQLSAATSAWSGADCTAAVFAARHCPACAQQVSAGSCRRTQTHTMGRTHTPHSQPTPCLMYTQLPHTLTHVPGPPYPQGTPQSSDPHTPRGCGPALRDRLQHGGHQPSLMFGTSSCCVQPTSTHTPSPAAPTCHGGGCPVPAAEGHWTGGGPGQGPAGMACLAHRSSTHPGADSTTAGGVCEPGVCWVGRLAVVCMCAGPTHASGCCLYPLLPDHA